MAQTPSQAASAVAEPASEKIVQSDEQWRRQLTPIEYQITRRAGTEQAYTGEYWQTKTKGVYTCRCCHAPLFGSDAKYDSGTGWPSFYEPVSPEAVATKKDRSWFMVRTEALCARCDAHLGHVFPDGPAPTGLRFCMNSASLKLEADD